MPSMKGGYSEDFKYKKMLFILLLFPTSIIPCLLIHTFEAISEKLQCQ